MNTFITIATIIGIIVVAFIILVGILAVVKIYKLGKSLMKEMPKSVEDVSSWQVLWSNMGVVYPHVGSLTTLHIYEVTIGDYCKFVRANLPFNALLIALFLEPLTNELPAAEITLYSERGVRMSVFIAPVNLAIEWCEKIKSSINMDTEPYEGTIQ